ncbi:hypothetical protein N0V84_011736 [Fusarium piperis]|uniref:Protein kinase domain-containing protein n=1 Tax=Fusarium piperis TaxID=1435070 RepID=A0A9W8TD03_9HYPO|nr:hypothetical protein N0V84_011736 [Fusarium piperis]
MAWSRPFPDLTEEEVEERYALEQFPSLGDRVVVGHVIWNCWNEVYCSAAEVIASLEANRRHVVLKVHVNYISQNRELHVLQHFEAIKSEHPGRRRIRMLDDHFVIQGPHGNHVAFVLSPLGVSVKLLQDLQPGGIYDEETTVSAVQQALIALDFLHCEAGVIHTGRPTFREPASRHYKQIFAG